MFVDIYTRLLHGAGWIWLVQNIPIMYPQSSPNIGGFFLISIEPWVNMHIPAEHEHQHPPRAKPEHYQP
jgi:hypothetical protein